MRQAVISVGCRLLVAGLCGLLLACSGDDGAGGSRDTEAEGSTSTATEGGPGATSTSGPDGTGGTAPPGGSGSDPCEGVSPSHGKPCDTPGAECTYGDDCGSWDYQCEDGIWVTIDASTCGEVPIACEDGPADGDPCWGQEVCDPDGDCRDVLQCEAGTWTVREICSAEYCVGAEQGGACDEIDRTCPYPCGPDTPVFRCTAEGWDGTNLSC